MARVRKPPRLELRSNGSSWSIVHAGIRISTGKPGSDILGAEACLSEYNEKGVNSLFIHPRMRKKWRAKLMKIGVLAPSVRVGKKAADVIYVVTNAEDSFYPIKVGLTRREILGHRLISIQTGNPHKLIIALVFDGDSDVEAALHKSLKKHRISGEWYRRCPEVLNGIINAAKSGASSTADWEMMIASGA